MTIAIIGGTGPQGQGFYGFNLLSRKKPLKRCRLFLSIAAGTLTVFGACSTFAASAVPAANAVSDNAGQLAYQKNCMSCHGEKLHGAAFGPPLEGETFRTKWKANGATALYNLISQKMPPSNPGGLSPQVYHELTAFVLRSNKMEVLSAEPAKGAPVQDNTALSESGGLTSTGENHDAAYLEAMARRNKILQGLTPVDDRMLRNPPAEDWLNWRRTDDGYGFSPLHQINQKNASSLTVAWTRALPIGTNAITPLVHDGVMFLDSKGTVLAIDVATGNTLWSFVRQATASLIGPPVTQPRGIAIYENNLYVPTSDNHMIALDIHTGKIVWDHLITGMQGTLRPTAAPIVVHGKVIQGMSGCAGVGEPGGCFIVGLDAKTGTEIWRFHTIARAGQKDGDTWNGAPTEKRFGASVWSPGTYDAENNLVYFGTGQTYHIETLMSPNSKRRHENAGLYTDTTLALNPDTGKLVWYYQHMARDVWDLDWSFERIITTLPVDGKPRKVVLTVGKLGILDVLDAKSGEYLFSYDMGYQNLVTAIDPVTGWKTTNPAYEPDTKQSKFLCPFPIGVRNWPATSYNPLNHLLYVPATDSCMDFSWLKGENFDITYGVKPRPGNDGNIGALMAIDLNSRKAEWQIKHRAQESSAILATAGGLVFEGGRDRVFRASDSSSGKILWQIILDNPPSATPITFAKDGIQYVAITSGGGNPDDVIASSLTPEIEVSRPGITLWVFRVRAP